MRTSFCATLAVILLSNYVIAIEELWVSKNTYFQIFRLSIHRHQHYISLSLFSSNYKPTLIQTYIYINNSERRWNFIEKQKL